MRGITVEAVGLRGYGYCGGQISDPGARKRLMTASLGYIVDITFISFISRGILPLLYLRPDLTHIDLPSTTVPRTDLHQNEFLQHSS